jgi:Fe-S-cluster-containing hydrogenase component 2
MHRAKGGDVVLYDRSKCIGCRMCTMACPFGNAVYDGVTGSILKCDICGGSPECVKVCPNSALEYVDDNISTRTRKKSFAAKFKSAFEEK